MLHKYTVFKCDITRYLNDPENNKSLEFADPGSEQLGLIID